VKAGQTGPPHRAKLVQIPDYPDSQAHSNQQPISFTSQLKFPRKSHSSNSITTPSGTAASAQSTNSATNSKDIPIQITQTNTTSFPISFPKTTSSIDPADEATQPKKQCLHGFLFYCFVFSLKFLFMRFKLKHFIKLNFQIYSNNQFLVGQLDQQAHNNNHHITQSSIDTLQFKLQDSIANSSA
jgi:hypothetical protein